ncbi:MAG: hypothetical protein A2Z50_05340 [Nitrospirae bacterium RBG_19FT_COMBO_42_15]|nr:MAG: hypothetical protein A2Z50_05340 [Nitrospirae bacterium RBG_19FT_COMBO_42_15]
MKKGLILLIFLFLIISVSFAGNMSMIASQSKTSSEPISLLLSGSVLIVVGILTRKRLMKK